MITSLTKQQLAFILDIKAEEARAKMCVAYCKFKGIENEAVENDKGKIVDKYPVSISIEILSKHLNLPTLQSMVNDIEQSYLMRPASKKWILCDFPETTIRLAEQSGKDYPIKINLPPALRSMLPKETLNTVYESWKNSFLDKDFKPKLKVPIV